MKNSSSIRASKSDVTPSAAIEAETPAAATVAPGTISFANLGEIAGSFASPVQDPSAADVNGSGLDATLNTSGGSGGVIQATSSPFAGDGGDGPSDNTLQFHAAPDSSIDDVRLTSTDGTEFQLDSMVIGAVVSNAATVTVLGFRDGVQVASTSFSTSTNSTGNAVDGNQTISFDGDWANIDEIRISVSGADVASISVDDLVVAAAAGGGSNTAPEITASPTEVTVLEETASNLDLSAVSLTDADGDDPITLTISVGAGTLAVPGGSSGGVNAVLVNSTTLTLEGSAADIATYLDTASNITYTGATDASGNNQATVTLTPNDGTEDGTAALVNVNITDVNDAPTLTATGADPSFTEGNSAVSLFSGASASTVEAGQTFSGLTLTVTNVAEGSIETLTVDGTSVALTDANGGTTATNSLDYSVAVSGTTATVTLSGGTLSAADLQTLVDGISYANTSENPGSDDRVITITSLSDSGGTANGGADTATLAVASTVTVAPLNDDPTVTGLPTDVSVTQETASNVDLSEASFDDVDSDTITVTLTASSGTFAAPADGSGVGAGVTATLVNATTITLAGSPVDITSYLDTASNITYTGAEGTSGEDAATISLTMNDGDGSGDVSAGTVNLDIEATSNAIIGTGNADTLTGGDTDDLIYGKEADDLLTGGAGNDTIFGCDDNDRLLGGDGDDILNGEAGNDTLLGGAGNDNLTGGAGTDTASYTGAAAGVAVDTGTSRATNDGDGGTDTLSGIEKVIGSNFNDTLTGGAAADDLAGSNGDDTIVGGGENDTLRGDDGNDVLDGGDGGDRLLGGEGNDVMLGGSGGDTMTGANGDDVAQGGDGNDFFFAGGDFSDDDDKVSGDAGNDLIGGRRGNDLLVGDGTDQFGTLVTTGGAAGADSLFGGNGDDTIYGDHHDGTNPDGGAADGRDALWGGHGNDIIFGGGNDDVLGGGTGNDKIDGQSGNDTLYGGSSGTDTLDGGSGNDLIFAGGDNDSVSGGTGDDVMFGGSNDDRVDGGAGKDEIYGGSGNDTLIGAADADTLRGGKGNDDIDGGTGDDLIRGQNGNDTLGGGADNDKLWGGSGSDSITGGTGNDTINGEDGSDTLIGGDGDDILSGGANDDRLEGGSGNDDLTGGDGADTFIFGAASGNDTVSDFNASEDSLDLSGNGITDLLGAAAETTQDGDAGVLIDLGGGNSVFLVGLTLTDLGSSDVTL